MIREGAFGARGGDGGWLPGSLLLALAWLVPGGALPWPNAQSDVAVAALFCAAGCVVFCRRGCRPALSSLAIAAFCLALTPALQYATGLVPFAGEAWVYGLYLFGLAMAIALGSAWQSSAPDEPLDALFLAIAVAAVLSVGLQLCQWLELDLPGGWLLPSDPSRTHASFGQPNNLGTFLLWGALAFAWGYHRRRIRGGLALLGIVFLVFGIALTQSRTAVLSALLLAGTFFVFRNRVEGGGTLARGAATAFLALLAFRLALPLLTEALGLAHDMRRTGTADAANLRLSIYRLFLVASLERPLGYGWNGVGEAFLDRLLDGPGLLVFFAHAHNLFLDLLVSLGWAVGLPFVIGLCVWTVATVRAVRSPGELLPVLVVMVAGCHAMLELPLHYAALLLPAGMMAGVVEQRTGRCRFTVAAGWLEQAWHSVLSCLPAWRGTPWWRKRHSGISASSAPRSP